MKKAVTIFFVFLLLIIHPAADSNDKPAEIKLPAPQATGGMPLMQALKNRRTTRSFSKKELPLQVVSNLLWAAKGVNRKRSKHLTAPSAMNSQEIDVYVAMKQGLYIFDPFKHRLIPVMAKDMRRLTGTQYVFGSPPLTLIYVADYSRAVDEFYAAADTGFISQNVYLYCASEGLATVVRGLVERGELAKVMKLKSQQAVILCQSVGYPRK